MQNDALSQAIAYARSGHTSEARAILLKILQKDPANERAWMWLVQIFPDRDQRISVLKQWLKVDPGSQKARQGLALLGSPAPYPPGAAERTQESVPGSALQPVPAPEHQLPPPRLLKRAEANPAELADGEENGVQGGVSKWFRKEAQPSHPDEEEDDLGLSFDPAENTPRPVHSTQADLAPSEPAETEEPPAGSQETEVQETPFVSHEVLSDLRGSAKKQASSRQAVAVRRLFQSVLYLMMAGVFVFGVYIAWLRYGHQAADMVTARLFPSPTPSPTVPTPLPSLTPLPTLTPTPTPTPEPRPAAVLGKIVFAAPGPEGNLDIYAMPAEDGQPDNLTPQKIGENTDPAISTAGLLYSLDWVDLYLLDPAGRLHRLTDDGAGNREPAWSPDGKQIAFVSERDGDPEIYVMNADGSEPLRITQRDGLDGSPAWSPDGSWLVFVSEENGLGQLFITKTDGSEINPLLLDQADKRSPNWSPDGKWIAYSSESDGNREIFIIASDGSSARQIASSPAQDSDPVWSEDGEWLLFTSDRTRAGENSLYAVQLTTGWIYTYSGIPTGGVSSPDWVREGRD